MAAREALAQSRSLLEHQRGVIKVIIPSVAAGVGPGVSMLAWSKVCLSCALIDSDTVDPGAQVSGTRDASGFLPPPYVLSMSFGQLGKPRKSKELTGIFEPE